MEVNFSDSEELYGPSSPKPPPTGPATSSDEYDLDDSGLSDNNGALDPVFAPVKRKLEDSDQDDVIKRQKVVTKHETIGNLPVPVLQHVFSFLSISDLFHCLHVNRHWRNGLTFVPDSFDNGGHSLQLRSGDEIWGISRKNFTSGLPEPLKGTSEFRMLTLLLGKRCEQCEALPTLPAVSSAVWNSGPGRDESRAGVRIIWHFAVRLCGNCLENYTAKDIELIVTSDKSLLPGLPFVLRTADMHYVPPSLISGKHSVPPNIQLSKVYYRLALSKLRQVHEGLPADVVETWLGGLRDKGKRTMDDAARWVAWEASLPGISARQATLDMIYPKFAAHQNAVAHTIANTFVPDTMYPHHLSHLLPHLGYSGYTTEGTPEHSAATPGHQSDYAGNLQAAAHAYQYNPASAMHTQLGAPAPVTDRSKPSLSDVKQQIAERKAEIERRCMEDIIPPLFPSVLEHIPAFQAALKIAKPFDDDDWRFLEPRLLAGRLEAEQAEHHRSRNFDSTQYVNSITQRTNRRAPPGSSAGGDPKKERQQKPVRRRLVDIAQEVIEKRWAGGSRLNKQDCANFAADVIVTTLSWFRQSTDPSEFEMGLAITLESVKNLYDVRVKPVMDKLNMKDVFLCAECEDSTKWYSFDGMMQHFGAKHSDDFGTGNVVVAWQVAEWPEEPPFCAHPVRSRRVPPAYAEAAVVGLGLSTNGSDQHGIRQVSLAQVFKSQAHSVSTPPPNPGINLPSFLSSLRQPTQSVVDEAAAGDDSDRSEEYEPEPVHKVSKRPVVQQPIAGAGYMSSTPEVAASKHVSDNPALKAFQAPPQTVGVEPREQVAKSSVELLKSTGGLPDLADSVRLYVIIHHIDRRYFARFNKRLIIEVFRESLASRNEMKPFKTWKNLICKACVDLAHPTQRILSSELLINSNKTHSMGGLLAHFQVAHIGHDFLTDMLELSDLNTLRALPYISGMTDQKLQLIASALPESVFPAGVPQAKPPQHATAEEPVSQYRSSVATSNLEPDYPAGDWNLDGASDRPSNRKVGAVAAQNLLIRGHGRNGSGYDTEFSMPEAAEDEYDPRRPIMHEQASDEESDYDLKYQGIWAKKAKRSSHKAPENINSGPTTDDQAESSQRRRKVSKKHENAKKGPNSEKFFDYRTVEIPDVIRTEYNPNAPKLQERPQKPSSSHRRASSVSSAHREQGPPVGPLSPPRYFDQWGNPVVLEQIASSMPQPQQLTAPSGSSWYQALAQVPTSQAYHPPPPGYVQPYASFGQPQQGYGYPQHVAAPQYGQYQPVYPQHQSIGYGAAAPSGPQSRQSSSTFGPGGVQYVWDDSD
ncbi:hypothetical protein K461DRAFT_325134 [Myriangium duriaei CBS 260.36]|uniref:F-box domain-containing protein n=1 Tax=Myriangium duriaei CBS 260.36 TaxID=1168546 RepID=A0A9P4MBL0_9PEZI|nr:hypothetical protein K461DRAFT_325134 [Myriangium duriaei CBS 260.36]